MKRTKYDGRLHTYVFGDRRTDTWKTKATSLARAVRMFRVGVLTPFKFAKGRIGEERMSSDGWDRTAYLRGKPNAEIRVSVVVAGGDWKTVAHIKPEDPESEYDPRELPKAVTAMLDSSPASESTGLITDATAGSIANKKRSELDDAKLTLEEKLGKLTLLKRELQDQVSAIQAELKRRMEQVWMIELFLGSKEEVVRLREGEPAPASERITVRQRVLCMDEEIAVHQWLHEDDPDREFDYTDIGAFDQWLLDNPARLDAVIPNQKGIVALRVRRKGTTRRGYADGVAGLFQKIAEEEEDRCVYLLVRNGEQLYRLWVDVTIWPRFFPRINEWDWMNEKDHVASWDHDKVEEQSKQFVAGLLVVQGLVQRSDLLHPLPKALDVFNPADAETYFDCVRDDENDALIGDGNELASLTWDGYSKWLKSKLAPGVRVFWWQAHSRGSDDRLERRTGINSVCAWPKKGEPYTLDEIGERRCSFLYLPDDDVYGGRESRWAVNKRTKRVRFDAYKEELWPVDFLSWRVVRHLLLDRGQRQHYSRFFPLLARWYKINRAEREQERPFIDLVISGVGCRQDDEPVRARAERILRWWKVKTKTHRTLMTDDAKALRMCVRELGSDRDHDDDPETLLPQTGATID